MAERQLTVGCHHMHVMAALGQTARDFQRVNAAAQCARHRNAGSKIQDTHRCLQPLIPLKIHRDRQRPRRCSLHNLVRAIDLRIFHAYQQRCISSAQKAAGRRQPCHSKPGGDQRVNAGIGIRIFDHEDNQFHIRPFACCHILLPRLYEEAALPSIVFLLLGNLACVMIVISGSPLMLERGFAMPAPVIPQRFPDRRAAGRALALALSQYADRPRLQVLALPRGGVPVAYEVAQALHAPLDVLLVRKLGAPGQPELAMGAIAEQGARVLNHDIIADLGIPAYVIEEITALEQAEIARRARAYRGQRPPPELHDKTVIIVDDGLATGATMHAAVNCVRLQQPRWITVAVPVASTESVRHLRTVADDVVAVLAVEPFYALSYWYDDFRQTSDDEVRRLLQASLPASAVPHEEGA